VITIVAQMSVIAATIYIPVAIAVVISAAIPVVILPVSLFFLRRTESVTISTAVGALFACGGPRIARGVVRAGRAVGRAGPGDRCAEPPVNDRGP
jgi:hypothetical protein